MANTLTWGGNPDNTSGYTSGSAYFQTSGLDWPDGNPDLGGTRRVYMYSCDADYMSGGTGAYARVTKDGETSGAAGWRSSGGSFNFRVGHTSGTQYVGRNTAASGSMVSSVDGRVFDGPICGSLSWATYPLAPRSPQVTRTGRDVKITFSGPSSNGGATITRYEAQYSTNGGSTYKGTKTTTTGSVTFEDLPPGSYKFRIYAVNTLGAGADVETSTVVVPAGGKRASGESFVSTQIARRWNGTAWVDLTTAKRYAGTAFTDLS